MTKYTYQLTDYFKHKSDLQSAIDTLENHNGTYEIRSRVKKIKKRSNSKVVGIVDEVTFAVYVEMPEGVKEDMRGEK